MATKTKLKKKAKIPVKKTPVAKIKKKNNTPTHTTKQKGNLAAYMREQVTKNPDIKPSLLREQAIKEFPNHKSLHTTGFYVGLMNARKAVNGGASKTKKTKPTPAKKTAAKKTAKKKPSNLTKAKTIKKRKIKK